MINAIISPKGGSGKSTLTANIGAFLADSGYQVLIVDADKQQTLSSYFSIKELAEEGLKKIIHDVDVSQVISKTNIDNLDLIYSDDPHGELEGFIKDTADGSFRLRHALNELRDRYDFIFVDTIGSTGRYLDIGLYAADVLLTPILPESLSAREIRSTKRCIQECQAVSRRQNFNIAPLYGVINRFEKTIDAESVMETIQRTAKEGEPVIHLLDTILYKTTVYPSAATARQPVHRFETSSSRKSGSTYEATQSLIYELFKRTQADIKLPTQIPVQPANLKEVAHG